MRLALKRVESLTDVWESSVYGMWMTEGREKGGKRRSECVHQSWGKATEAKGQRSRAMNIQEKATQEISNQCRKNPWIWP